MKRGDVVTAEGAGHYVVVQGGWTLDAAATVTLCPISTRVLGIGRVRVPVEASAASGLACDGEVAVDRIATVRRASVGEVVGTLPPDAIRRVDRSLKNWLDL